MSMSFFIDGYLDKYANEYAHTPYPEKDYHAVPREVRAPVPTHNVLPILERANTLYRGASAIGGKLVKALPYAEAAGYATREADLIAHPEKYQERMEAIIDRNKRLGTEPLFGGETLGLKTVAGALNGISNPVDTINASSYLLFSPNGALAEAYRALRSGNLYSK